jgi:hypothetical protein
MRPTGVQHYLPHQKHNKKGYFWVLWLRVWKLEVVHFPVGCAHPGPWFQMF